MKTPVAMSNRSSNYRNETSSTPRLVVGRALGLLLAGTLAIVPTLGAEDLEEAIKAKDPAQVRSLLEAEPARIHQRNDSKRTPLHGAANWGDRDTLAVVLEFGPEIDARDKVGITGGSYGGYASAWGATYYSERFAAARFVFIFGIVLRAPLFYRRRRT